MSEEKFIDFSGEVSLGSYMMGIFLSLVCSIFFPHSMLAWFIVVGVPGALLSQWMGRYEAKRYIREHY